MNIEWIDKSPFVKIDTSHLEAGGKNIYEAFKNYATTLQEVVTRELPELLEKAKALPGAAEDAQKSAAGELGSLDFGKKAKAGHAILVNTRLTSKVPAFVQAAITQIKGDL